MTEALRSHFADYAAFHTDRGEQGLPRVRHPDHRAGRRSRCSRASRCLALGGFELTLAEVVIALFVAYYLTLDATLAAVMLAAYVALDAAGALHHAAARPGLFVVGWILQGVGHWVYEKNSPAFFRNFVHLAVGQLWILAKALGRA